MTRAERSASTGYQPQVGDRVSLTGTVKSIGGTACAGVALEGWGPSEILIGVSHLTLVERPPPVEEWQPGDVVRNADDPGDVRVWMYSPLYGHDESWLWHRHEADGLTASAIRYSREQLPGNLRLLVRAGQPAAQPQPEPAHPQPGDVVTEEPPVGSIVRDRQGDTHERGVADGDNRWFWHDVGGVEGDRVPWTWSHLRSGYAPLTLVRWGAEQ